MKGPVPPPQASLVTPRGEARITLPAGEFYWSVIRADERGPWRALGHRRLGSRIRLGYLFEEEIPVPIEEVYPAYARFGGVIVACGMPRDRVAEVVGTRTRVLLPAGLPAWVREAIGSDGPLPELSGLNILRGDAEPGTVRRARRMFVAHLGLCAALVLACFLLQVERWVRGAHGMRLAAEARAEAAYASVLGAAPGGQPPAVRLASELRTLERLRPAALRDPVDAEGTEDFDAAAALAWFLGGFPDLTVMTESIEVTPSRILLTATTSTAEDAQRLAEAWNTPHSPATPWRLQQPQVSADRRGSAQEAVRITLALERADLRDVSRGASGDGRQMP